MKKAHWFSSATFAFVALVVSSFYRTFSAVSLLKNWNEEIHNSTNQFQVRREPVDSLTTKGNVRRHPLTVSSGGGDDQRLDDVVIAQSIQRHFSVLSRNPSFKQAYGEGVSSSTNALKIERLRVLETLLKYFSNTSDRIESDVVELRHCRLEVVDYSNFSSWAAVILVDAWSKIESKLEKRSPDVQGLGSKDDWEGSMYLEFCLGLLEIYVTHSKGENNTPICDFQRYPLEIQRADLISATSALRSISTSTDGLPRLVFAIVAFQDANHLETLIEACFMPHHLIIVHLERLSPPLFTERVHEIANKYTNVVVVQFGSIIYTTDSVSTVNYQIMHWVTNELGISYDYFLTLGNAAFPLYNATELANYFKTTKRDIWLGEMRNSGNQVASGYLERKRLIFTAGAQKYTQRTKKWKQSGFDSTIPDYIKNSLSNKTNSGNQAVFSYKVVKKLIDSPIVRELFSIAKYGCCCCLEERTWVAAARIVGHGREALERASMFQVWGGKPVCGDGSMKNALLIANATTCYKSEDVTSGNIFERQQNNTSSKSHGGDPYFRGDQLLEELRLAKERGFLFARKFVSTDPESLQLLETIKTNIHHS